MPTEILSFQSSLNNQSHGLLNRHPTILAFPFWQCTADKCKFIHFPHDYKKLHALIFFHIDVLIAGLSEYTY